MLIHKRTMGIIEEEWTGTVLRPVTLANHPELDRDDWWELPGTSPMARTARIYYPWLEPEVDEDGCLIGLRPSGQGDREEKARTAQQVKKEIAASRGYRQTRRLRPMGVMPFLRAKPEKRGENMELEPMFSNGGQISGVTCGVVCRLGNGAYKVVFERARGATLEAIEAIPWDHPDISDDCALPVGYGYECKGVEYNMQMQHFSVHLRVGRQYLGDVQGMQQQQEELLNELEDTKADLDTAKIQLSNANSQLKAQNETIRRQQAELDAIKTMTEGKDTAQTENPISGLIQPAVTGGDVKGGE